MHFGASPGIFKNAKDLRHHLTRDEEVLWHYLKANQLQVKFRRQHPMSKYVVDFYCHYYKLVIELDGGIHYEPNQIDKDDEKEKDLINLGLTVLRFSIEEVLFDARPVLDRILDKMSEIKWSKK